MAQPKVTVTRAGSFAPLNLNLKLESCCLRALHVKRLSAKTPGREKSTMHGLIHISTHNPPRRCILRTHNTRASMSVFTHAVPEPCPELKPSPIASRPHPRRLLYPCSLPPCLYSALPPLPIPPTDHPFILWIFLRPSPLAALQDHFCSNLPHP